VVLCLVHMDSLRGDPYIVLRDIIDLRRPPKQGHSRGEVYEAVLWAVPGD